MRLASLLALLALLLAAPAWAGNVSVSGQTPEGMAADTEATDDLAAWIAAERQALQERRDALQEAERLAAERTAAEEVEERGSVSVLDWARQDRERRTWRNGAAAVTLSPRAATPPLARIEPCADVARLEARVGQLVRAMLDAGLVPPPADR